MLRRFLAVFGLILLYMLVLALVMLPVLLLAGDNDTLILITVLVMLVVAVVILVPYLDWVVKRVFYFKGQGEPIAAAELRAHIQAINQFDAPVLICPCCWRG